MFEVPEWDKSDTKQEEITAKLFINLSESAKRKSRNLDDGDTTTMGCGNTNRKANDESHNSNNTKSKSIKQRKENKIEMEMETQQEGIEPSHRNDTKEGQEVHQDLREVCASKAKANRKKKRKNSEKIKNHLDGICFTDNAKDVDGDALGNILSMKMKKKKFPEAPDRENHCTADKSLMTQNVRDSNDDILLTKTKQSSMVQAGNRSIENDFRNKLAKKLSGAQFRWINEQLYTMESCNAFDMLHKDPSLFDVYHRGFQHAVESWPCNPVDIMIAFLQNRPADLTVVDMGCGEAKIAQNVKQRVYSFDLLSRNSFVTACDMSKIPVDTASADVVIFCLSLMGTNIADFLHEANRVLKIGGLLKIAEVVSRFGDIDEFIRKVCAFGFKFHLKDTSNKMFIVADFEKTGKSDSKSNFTIYLKPCVYKRR